MNDQRGALTAGWVTSVTSTAFTTGGATGPETISNASISYWSGAATSSSGLGTKTPGQATSANAVDMSVSRTAFTQSTGTGNNAAAWNPTLIVTPPAASVAGTYSGTVTHSVA